MSDLIVVGVCVLLIVSLVGFYDYVHDRPWSYRMADTYLRLAETADDLKLPQFAAHARCRAACYWAFAERPHWRLVQSLIGPRCGHCDHMLHLEVDKQPSDRLQS